MDDNTGMFSAQALEWQQLRPLSRSITAGSKCVAHRAGEFFFCISVQGPEKSVEKN